MKLSDRELHNWGFTIGLTASMDSLGRIIVNRWFENSNMKDVVFVLVGPNHVCLKVGEAGQSFRSRLNRTFSTVNRPKHRHGSLGHSERNFQAILRKHLLEKNFSVWLKPAKRKRIQLIRGKEFEISMRHSEEEYFTKCFDPKIRGNLRAKK